MSIDEILINIRKTISSSKNVLMYFDTDTDGSCSYLQLRKAFSQIKSGFPISKDDESQKRAMDFFKDDFDLIIFFDTPYVNKDLIEKIGKTRIIWVDHHLDFGMKKYCEDHKNLFGFNPVWFNENDSRCSSYWAYKISGLRENLFYVCMASVADFYLLNVVKELYYEDKKLFNLLFDIDEVMREEIFDFLKKTRYDSVDDFDKKAYYIKYLSYNTDLIVFKNFFDLIYKLNRSEEVSMNTLNYIEKLSPLDFKAELFSGKIEHFEKFHVIFDEYNLFLIR